MMDFQDIGRLLLTGIHIAGPVLMLLACWRIHRLFAMRSTLIAGIASTAFALGTLVSISSGWIFMMLEVPPPVQTGLQWAMRIGPSVNLVTLPTMLFALAWHFHAARSTMGTSESS